MQLPYILTSKPVINESPSPSPSASKAELAGNPATEMLGHSRLDWGCLDKKGNDGAKSPKEVTCMAAQGLGARNTPLHTNLDNEALHVPSNVHRFKTHWTSADSRGCSTVERWMPLAERAEPLSKAVFCGSCAAVLNEMVRRSGDRPVSCLAWRWRAVTGLERTRKLSLGRKPRLDVSQSLTKTRLRSAVIQPRVNTSLVVCKNSMDDGRDRWHQGRSLTQKKFSTLGFRAGARASCVLKS